MKKIVVLLCALACVVSGCRSGTDLLLPMEIWSDGCVQLAPNKGAYRLSGMCCEYVSILEIQLARDGSFRVEGTYHSFTGAGFSSIPVRITGNLSQDKTTLTVNYPGAPPGGYTLKPGPAKLACDCYCD